MSADRASEGKHTVAICAAWPGNESAAIRRKDDTAGRTRVKGTTVSPKTVADKA